MTFEWDSVKAAANSRKHGVSFAEGATVFLDPMALTFDDPDHSEDEAREITIGVSTSQRVLFVSHTSRGRRTRLFSVRKATSSERKQYAQAI